MAILTPEQRLLVPTTVVRAAAPPSVQDSMALIELKIRLEDAQQELNSLTENPIVIAASPNRFNDVDISAWHAIRFGRFFTELVDYGIHSDHDFERDLAGGPDGARTARRVLDALETANWRNLFSDAFGLGWGDQVLALAIQDGIPWLVFSGSNHSDENHVFSLWGEHPLTYFGECVARFDWELLESPALRFEVPQPSDPETSV
jgi:hypothetical protein